MKKLQRLKQQIFESSEVVQFSGIPSGPQGVIWETEGMKGCKSTYDTSTGGKDQSWKDTSAHDDHYTPLD